MEKSTGMVLLLLTLSLAGAMVEGRNLRDNPDKLHPAQEKQQQPAAADKPGAAYHPQNFIGGVGAGMYGPGGTGGGGGVGYAFPGQTGFGQPFTFGSFPTTGALPGLPGTGGIGGGAGGGIIGHGVGQP